jgi:glycine cleavage system H protein
MDCNGCEFRPELYYDDEYQIWVRLEENGLLSVGMTDISQTIAGKILHVRVRRPGTLRPAGRPVATIESGKWAGPVPNLFDCTIDSANHAVLDTPALLNRQPYEAWIARVRPAAGHEAALAVLLTGEAAWAGYRARCARDAIQCKRIKDTSQD